MPANSPISSERELANRFDASRMTVRKAVSILEEEGFLYRDGNVGTFVADHNLRKTIKNQNISQIFNTVENYRIIYFDVKNNDEIIANQLEIEVEDAYIRIVRLNQKDDKPESLDEIYIVRKLVNDKDMNNITSILSYSGNLDNGSMKQEYSAVTIPVMYANLLKIDIDSPVMRIDSTIFTKNGKIYAHVVSYKHPVHGKIQLTF